MSVSPEPIDLFENETIFDFHEKKAQNVHYYDREVEEVPCKVELLFCRLSGAHRSKWQVFGDRRVSMGEDELLGITVFLYGDLREPPNQPTIDVRATFKLRIEPYSYSEFYYFPSRIRKVTCTLRIPSEAQAGIALNLFEGSKRRARKG